LIAKTTRKLLGTSSATRIRNGMSRRQV